METNLKPMPPVGSNRRDFLKWSGGALVAGGLLLESCKKSDDSTPTPTAGGGLTLTNDDFGILNFAYALEQLEADFYHKVVNDAAFHTTFSSMGEAALLQEIAAHEACHRDFFAKAIPDANRIQTLTTKYGSLNFADRSAVLTAAMGFEDLGVSAYNGAGAYITSTAYLTLAGKIVSVEARHAAMIRDILGLKPVDKDVVAVDYTKMPPAASFTSPISKGMVSTTPQTAAQLGFSTTNNSIEISRLPSAVLAMAGTFINETLVNKLP